jgi:hypothetical protein
VLFIGKRLVATEQFGVHLGKFLQGLPEFLIMGDSLVAVIPLGWGLEEELQNVARFKAADQVVEGAVLLSMDAGAVGFAARGKAFHIGGAEQIVRDGQPTQEGGLAVAQGQGGETAHWIYLGQQVG